MPETKPARAELQIILHPEGGYLSLDGRRAVRAPASFSNLRVGAHSLRMGFSREDLSSEERIVLKAGSNVIHLALVAQPAKIRNPFE
jgi:hypothetical protein